MTDAALSPRDFGALLGAVYALDLDEEGHIRALREAWARLPVGGELTTAFAFRADSAELAVLEHFFSATPEVRGLFEQVTGAASREYKLALLRSRPVFGPMSTDYGRTSAARTARELGFPEFRALSCKLPPTENQQGVAIGAWCVAL